ncbi:MAG: hypothetical protein IIB17_09255 [Chloroflexi bacterium]|nr:hypothetical protein [Chloroflexota bacterium]
MAEISGAQLVIDSLKREGVDTMYCLPGDPVGDIVNGWAEAGMRVISVRHEQTAAMAAQAHSYFTRSVGVCVAASGVGQTNTLTAIANAQVNCWPLLVIGGASELRRRNMGDFQELAQLESTAPLCKWAYTVESTERIPILINIAMRESLAGRPGPVYLDLPADMITTVVDESVVEIPEPHSEPARPLAEPDKIKQALEVLKGAERPLLIVGKGAAWSWAEDELLEFVDKTQIPFLTSPMGSGMLPPEHPLNVSSARTQALQGADVVLLVGARMNWIFHFGQPPRFAEEYKLIQVEIEPTEIGRNHAAEVWLVGDAKMVMRQLIDALDDNPVTFAETDWLGGLNEKSMQKADTIEPMLEKKLDGFGELFRQLTHQEIGTGSILSRATGGVIGGTVVLSFPGSLAAATLAMDKVILPELGHLVREETR